jgi:hypothetical protein
LAGCLVFSSFDTGEPASRQVKVTAPLANVRSERSATGPVVFQLKRGETATLVETSGDWYQIEDASGRRGYVFSTLVEVVEPAPAAAPPPVEAAVPAGLTIDHREIGCIVAEQFPKLDACFAPREGVGRAQVHFRALDTEPWYAIDLEPEGPCFTGYLPKPLKTTKELWYYVDVVDRGFVERQQPQGAPQGAYRVRVVEKQGDCQTLGRIAIAVARAAKPIIVGVAKNASGAAIDAAAAKLLEAKVLLAGFRPEGIVMASTGAAPASAASASTSGSAGGGSGAGGGGLSTTTIVVGAGVAAAAGVVVAVAGGGGGGNSGGGSSNGGGPSPTTPPPPTTTPAQALAGRWIGSGNFREDVNNCDYTTSLDMTFAGSGTTLTGTFLGRVTGASGPDVQFCQQAVGEAFVNGPLSGTASNGSLTFTVQGPITFSGTYSATSMSGPFNGTSPPPFDGFRLTGTWSATKQ